MASGYVQLLNALRKGGPVLVKQLPKLWPLLLESSNRKKLREVAGDLASQSPTRRLRANVDVTAQLADAMARDTEASEADRARATEWARQARNLHLRLDMPVPSRQARAAHRRSVRADLEAIQVEMDDHLRR